MKFLLALVLLLMVAPGACITGVSGFVESRATYADVSLADLAGSSSVPKHVAVEGYLLRQLPPNGVFGDKGYWFPLVDEATARAAVAAGSYASPATGPLVFAKAHGEELPVEAFFPPSPGRSSLVAVPMALEGKRRAGLELPRRVAATFGVGTEREVRVVEAAHADMNLGGLIVTVGIGVLSFLWSVSYLRKWRRKREVEKALQEAQLAQVRARADARRAAKAEDGPPPRAGRSGAGSPVPSAGRGGGGGFSLPIKPIVGGLIVLGIAGARLGGKVAPKIDDVARGVAKSAGSVADDAGSAIARSADEGATRMDIPSAGEILLEGAGHAQTAAGVAQAVDGQDQGDSVPAAPLTGRIRLKVKSLEYEESYAPMERQPGDKALCFELKKARQVARMTGRITGYGSMDETSTDTSLPDRSKGEFTRITLTENGQGVRVVQEFAVSLEGGYVTVFEAAGDFEYVGGGSWANVLSGSRPVTLGPTDAGVLEFADGVAQAMGRVVEKGLRELGVEVQGLRASHPTPPVEEILLDKGELQIRQRGQSEAEITGRF